VGFLAGLIERVSDKWLLEAMSPESIYLANSIGTEKFPRGYVAALHDLITAYHDKLSEVLPPAEVERFRAATADRIMKNLTLKDDTRGHAMGQVSQLLAEWSLTLHTENNLGRLQCKIDCPYAHIVHPLYATPTFCPISTLVLGAARSTEPEAKLASRQLTDEGTEFIIES